MAQLIKSLNSLAIASVKARNGLAIASAKSVNGLDNTGGGGPSYLVDEGFEGAGAPAGWTLGAAADPDYISVVIAGSHSLRLTASAGTTANARPADVTAVSALYSFFLLRIISHPGSTQTIGTFRSAGSVRSTLFLDGSRRIRVQSTGGTANNGTDALPIYDATNGTTINQTTCLVWFEYVVDAGGVASTTSAGWTTVDAGGTKPTLTAGGAKSAVSSDGTSTATVDRNYLGSTATATFELVVDHYLLDDVAIGSNP